MDGRISQHHTVRQSYDAVAAEYLERFRGELAGKPLDRALLACLAEQAEGGAPVADLGCGPGHVAARLTGRGMALVGIDLSPAMIAAGRRDYPQVEFRQGDFLGLPAANGESRVYRPGVIHLVDFDAGALGSNRLLIQTVPREADTVAAAVISMVYTVLMSPILVQDAGVPGL